MKDASAMALYGMKAANGVIVIVTRRGIQQKNRIDVTIQSGLQSPVNTIDLLDAKDHMTLYNQAALNDGLPEKYSRSEIEAAGTSPLYPDVDWKGEALKKISSVSRANLTVNGGSQFIRYLVDFGFLYNNGIYKPSNTVLKSDAQLRRLNLRSNFDLQVTKSTLFSMDLYGAVDDRNQPAQYPDNIWYALYTIPPNAFNVMNPDGSYGGTSILTNNPIAMIEASGNSHSNTRFLNAGFHLKQDLGDLINGLSASIGYYIDNSTSISDGKWRNFMVSQIAPGGTGYYSYGEDTEYYEWSSSDGSRFTGFDAGLVYNMPEEKNHSLQALARFQSDQEWQTNADLTPYLTRNLGARIIYAYKKRYVLQLASSYYGSEQYPEKNRYGLFPSVALGWVFSNEDFITESAYLSYGKLKFSYGVTGRNPYANGRYPYYQYYVNGGVYPLGSDWSLLYGYQPGMLANPGIKWETSRMMNIGLELELFDKVSLESDFFIDKRSDVLFINYRHPSVLGVNLPYENIGKLTNIGTDGRIGYENSGNAIKWHADLLWTFCTNTIDEMGEALNEGELSNLNRTGNPVNAIYGYEVDGYFGSSPEGAPYQTFGPAREGDLKYRDQNNDNIIDARDMTMIGDGSANIDLGLSAGMTYAGFDFEILFQGQFSRDVLLSGNPLYQPFVYGNAATEYALKEDFPRLTLSNMNNYQPSSYWVENINFLKLRNLELGYSLNGRLVQKLSIHSFRIFVRGINLLDLSNWDYSDPEFFEIGYMPMRVYYFGINISF
ncbi:MAG: SusC/RagA family TonB-linked outer membrane protein [Bacteroidales bacterium]|nr:SusC/RagA family TonB-linked outer membrane protein [Bacteroidales bacterium]